MGDWMEVANAKDVQPGTGRVVYADGIPIALFNVNGEFYAIDNVCRHAGGPLGEGPLEGKVVTCPLHGWQYDIVSGECVMPGGFFQEKFETKVENGKVYVKV